MAFYLMYMHIHIEKYTFLPQNSHFFSLDIITVIQIVSLQDFSLRLLIGMNIETINMMGGYRGKQITLDDKITLFN